MHRFSPRAVRRLFVALSTLACAMSASAAGDITVLTAWYGQSCGTAHGNVTAHVQSRCNGRRSCNYPVEALTLGDPAPGCQKNFVVLYTCSDATTVRLSQLTAEASGRLLELSCLPAPTVPVPATSAR
jgi:hypothetical protein